MDVGNVEAEKKEAQKAAAQKPEEPKQSFFQSLFANLFKSSNPEAEKKRRLKAIAKTFSKTKYHNFYRPSTIEVLPPIAKLFYDIYKLISPAQIQFKSNQNPNLYKAQIINYTLSEKQVSLLENFDQQKIMEYDPLLVERIVIYPHTCYIGTRSFEGIANFVTYKHNLPGFKFGSNVRVIDYDGVSLPTAFTGAALEQAEGYPDYRQTIWWHPLLELAPRQTLVIPCKLPDYQGRFNVVAEGLSDAGTPLRAETSFTTE